MLGQVTGFFKMIMLLLTQILTFLNRKAKIKEEHKKEKLDELEKSFETRDPSDITSAFDDA